MDFLLQMEKRGLFFAVLHILNSDSTGRASAAEGEWNMKNNDLYLGMGMGLAVGVVSSLLMRPKKKDVKSAVARVIGDVADSVSKNMSW